MKISRMFTHKCETGSSRAEISVIPKDDKTPKAIIVIMNGREITVAIGPSHENPLYIEIIKGARDMVTITPAYKGERNAECFPCNFRPNIMRDRTAP